MVIRQRTCKVLLWHHRELGAPSKSSVTFPPVANNKIKIIKYSVHICESCGWINNLCLKESRSPGCPSLIEIVKQNGVPLWFSGWNVIVEGGWVVWGVCGYMAVCRIGCGCSLRMMWFVCLGMLSCFLTVGLLCFYIDLYNSALVLSATGAIYSRVDTDVLMEVAYSCNFLAVSDSSTCPDIGTSWCHAGIIEHFEIRGFKMTP